MTDAAIWTSRNKLRVNLFRHWHAPVPAERDPGPDGHGQARYEDGEADALQPGVVGGVRMAESLGTQEQKDDEDNRDP